MADQAELDKQLQATRQELDALRGRISELQRQRFRQTLAEDYELTSSQGDKVKFSSLFGEADDLLVIHNMGSKCPYCTLWADGFNGVAAHLQDRAPFVLVSPDDPATLKGFATGRGWTFRTLSSQGSGFTRDMGFEAEAGDPWPGVSAFHRESDGSITRTSAAFFGPGDEFCAVWHLFGLFQDGSSGWQPKFSY